MHVLFCLDRLAVRGWKDLACTANVYTMPTARESLVWLVRTADSAIMGHDEKASKEIEIVAWTEA